MDSTSPRSFRYPTVIAVVIANMVGTGVFTSLGFQLLEIQSGFVLLALWAVGGVIALCGAMTYAELGAALPRSGGEYNFLARIYHPAAGFVSGWVSATIGFAGPTALAAMTFAAYATSTAGVAHLPWLREGLAVGLIVLLAAAHATSHRTSGGTQRLFTILKVAIIVVFCVAALAVVDVGQPIRFLPSAGDAGLVFSGKFAVALIYVSYAYTGWNAATYLSGELDEPQRTLPIVLTAGTLFVMVLYLALNYTFLEVAPVAAMRGQVEVGYVAASFAFGETAGRLMGMVLAALLISTVSAMLVAGPRVLQVIGEDFRAFEWLARKNRSGIPALAVGLQALLAIVFVLSGSFESVLVFAGFTLALNSFVTVFGLFVLRVREPDLPRPYRTFGYPVTPLVYLGITGWTLVFVLINRPVEGLFGLGVIASGLLMYGVVGVRDS
ncbi:MAG: amino acid permease [Woeseiaceae bacterium]|nr:amino acid permease [Woeseiaceae bacterium]